MKYQTIIIGGGLAGLASAIHLSKQNIKVLLIEKNSFPKHKVCGEYISNEVLPYLRELGFDPFTHGAKKINKLTISNTKSRTVSCQLPLGGFGISRYCMDSELSKLAIASGAEILQDAVTDIQFLDDVFQVYTSQGITYQAEYVIGAYGKRSNIDKQLSRNFIKTTSPYLAVKAHYQGRFPDNEVHLHNFNGGYCGLSKVESEHINVCYITDYNSFKKYKNIEVFQAEVMSQNIYLKEAFSKYKMVFEKPLTISQISFESKQAVLNHILMCGDSAGMIHPLAGNGMSMAIRAAEMTSDHILKSIDGAIGSRAELEESYKEAWNQEFKTRLTTGLTISKLFRMTRLTDVLIAFLKIFPFLLPMIIKQTHGRQISDQ